jgi:hypothetical protein
VSNLVLAARTLIVAVGKCAHELRVVGMRNEDRARVLIAVIGVR